MADPKDKRSDEVVALAYAEFGKLMADAMVVRRLFEAAELELPEPLKRLFTWESKQ